MYKIVVMGAGSAQSNGVINCLRKDKEENYIIGMGSDKYDLRLCKAHKKYLVPHSTKENYKEVLLEILKKEKPDMIHFQHDMELFIAMMFRKEIEDLGVKMLIPNNETIDTCVFKYKSWEKFKAAGLIVPNNLIINNESNLKNAFEKLGNEEGMIWLRSISIGGGGKGSLPTNDYETALDWINSNNGWGTFSAAEMLTKNTVTWLSIWYQGELIVCQGRKRKSWAHSALSPSGVTGVTKIGETISSAQVDEIAEKACKAVSNKPHGVYGVDLTYDKNGIPNPTEINIGRFFTTVQFFAEAGLNMPLILKNLCLYGKKPDLIRIKNPLKDGLLWIRAMDCDPVLTTEEEIDRELYTEE